MDCAGSITTRPPSFEAVKAAITQAQAQTLAAPRVEGCDMDAKFKGLDVLPLLSNKPRAENLGSSGG